MRLKNLLTFGLLAASALQATAAIVDGERQKPSFPTQGFVADQEVYMLNVGSGQFFTQGNAWTTQASLGSEPRLVKFQPNSAYDYTMLCYCWRSNDDQGGYMAEAWRNVFFDSETQMFVDRASQANYFFAVEEGDGTFRISTSQNNPTFGDYYGAGLYVGLPKNSTGTALSPFVDEDEAYVDWAIVSKEDYEDLADALVIYDKAQELKAWIDRIEAMNGDASTLKSVYLNEDATMEELQAAIDSAQPIYIQAFISNATDKENVDVTLALANPNYDDGETGWTVEAAPGSGPNGRQGNVRPGGSADNQCYEAWNNAAFDIYQKLENMPVGVYEIEVQGFYRYGRDETAWNAYLTQNVDYVKPTGVPVYIYLNNNATNFVNVFGDEQQITNATFYSTGSTDYSSHSNGGTTYYFPNGMASAAIAFSAGMYKQSAFGLIANEGDEFRIGVKGNSNQLNDSWVIWDNFKLYYRGFKAEVVKPVLETAIDDLQQYSAMLMGKTEFATLSTAFADAQTAIDNNDGEAMFRALNALYDVKESVIASKDIFVEQEVPADTVRLAEAIAQTVGKKLSNATLQAAQSLLAAIKGNTKYENMEIAQLKSDVTDAIDDINNSIAIYAGLNEAISAVKASVVEKAYQALIDEASALLPTAEAGYEACSLTDAEATAMTVSLQEKQSQLAASIAAYAQLKDAIARLQAAIDEVGESATKSALKKANLRLTASQRLYDEGSIADADIEARVQAIDELIEELTVSVRLRQQYDAAIEQLNQAVANAQGQVNDAMLQNATTLQTAIVTDYNEGNVDDANVADEIAKIENIVAALQAAPAAYEAAEQKLLEIAAVEAALADALTRIELAETSANGAGLTGDLLEQTTKATRDARTEIGNMKAANDNLKEQVESLVSQLDAVALTDGSGNVNSIKAQIEAIAVSGTADDTANLAYAVEQAVQQAIDITTGISAARYVDDGATWYDLSGHKLAGKPVRKGIYIRNGKRVTVK